ncbi:MAG: hypothetical protein IPO15_24105 [Anaerolineae bacterium]|nr:hypothetical protein [Anaerolineae bacterium]
MIVTSTRITSIGRADRPAAVGDERAERDGCADRGPTGHHRGAAVGLANQILFLLHLFFFGVGSGAAIFSAQFVGRGDVKNVRSILGLALLLAVGGSVVFTLAAQLAPTFLLRLYSNDPAVIAWAAVICAWPRSATSPPASAPCLASSCAAPAMCARRWPSASAPWASRPRSVMS